MNRYRVVVSPRGLDSLRRLDSWWRENRPDQPDLLRSEFQGAVAKLSSFPRAGRRYSFYSTGEVRRVLMPKTQNHVYYVIEGAEVQVIVVWGAIKGKGPSL